MLNRRQIFGWFFDIIFRIGLGEKEDRHSYHTLSVSKKDKTRSMSIRDWFNSIPEATPGHPTYKEIQLRHEMIVQAVSDGYVVYNWAPIKINESLTIFVTDDALQIGKEGDSIRFAVNTETQQKVADILDSYLPTAKIVDIIWKNSKKLLPNPQKISASKYAIHKHHLAIEKAKKDSTGVISGWKDWCIGKAVFINPNKAINYGWHVDTEKNNWMGIRLSPGVTEGKVIQPAASAHDIHHTDYSQLCRLVKKKALFNGSEVDLADIISEQDLAYMISSEGMLDDMRHPGVPLSLKDTVTHPRITNKGEKGPEVVRWQRFLIRAGYGKYLKPWGADGVHGKATSLATKAWAKRK